MNEQTKKYPLCKTAFGGSLLKNSHAKTRRPFSKKMSMHVVLKARKHCLKHYDQRVERIIERQARLHQVKIYNLQNVGNHIHIVAQTKNKERLHNFLRATTGLISRKLKAVALWLQRPFSRIVRWGRDFKTLKNYMKINQCESQGYNRKQARFMLEMGWVAMSDWRPQKLANSP
jgi:REP element-mobilizing transposase RayT